MKTLTTSTVLFLLATNLAFGQQNADPNAEKAAQGLKQMELFFGFTTQMMKMGVESKYRRSEAERAATRTRPGNGGEIRGELQGGETQTI